MSEQSHKIKTELFRFASLRKPKLIDQDAKKIGFVTNRDPANSYYLKALQNEPTLESAREALPGLAKKYKNLKRIEDIRGLDENLYRFSGWLMQNRSHLHTTDLTAAMAGVRELSANKRTTLWDNLYTEVIHKTAPPIRHACIQMLLADHFILYHQSEELLEVFGKMAAQRGADENQIQHRYLRRLAHASVAIHYVFGGAHVTKTDKEEDDRFPQDLFRDHDTFIRNENIRDLNTVVMDLDIVQKEYEREKTQVHELAVQDYDKKVQEEARNFDKANKLEGLNREALNKINPDTLPEFSQPEFTVKYPAPLSESFLKTRVRPETLGFVQKNKRDDADLNGMRRSVNDLIKKEKKGLFANQKGGRKRVKLAGKAYAINTVREGAFTVDFRLLQLDEEGRSALCLTLCTGQRSAFVKSMRYSIQIGDGQERKATDYKERNRNKTTLFLELFPGKSMTVTDGLVFTFRAELELSDGQQWKLDLTGQTGLKTNWAKAVVMGKSPRETELQLAFEGVDMYGVNRVGIADYRLVEQEVCCYVPGEVSHIENILAREYKERHTRSLTSTETTTESESQYEVENQTDTSTTERNELNTEIASILDEERSNSFGISTGVSGSYFGVDMSLDTGVDFASSNSSSDSNTMAKNYAVEVTKAATERVLQKTTEKRISKILQEYEENNRHGFDNRAGDQHVTGIYRWVDKVMTNRLVNYGKRLVYEFLIPEPSKFYRQAIEIQAEEEESSSTATLLVEPDHPSDLKTPIRSAADIDEDTYSSVAALYGASTSAPPNRNPPSISESYASSSLKQDEFSQVLTPPIIIPADYMAVRTTGTLTYDWKAEKPSNDGGAFINITFAGENYKSGTREGKRKRSSDGLEFKHDDITGTLTGSVHGNKLYSFNISLVTELELKPEVFEQWQVDTFEAIMNAYEQKKAEYDASLEQEEAGKDNETKYKEFAASMYRQLEQTELKRLAIEMMLKPYGIRQGRSFTEPSNCGVPQVIQDENWETYSAHVKFFEQAFDWSIMSYLFYPYYWAKKCDWVELFQAQTGDDEIFSAFLQSGMARMTVPVRLGFEKAVTYFMATGEIWMGGDLVLESDDDLYLSVAEEMEVIEGQVEEEWQTTLPTSLNIVQKDSASLDAGGLPCCDDITIDGDGNPIVVSTNVLSAPETDS